MLFSLLFYAQTVMFPLQKDIQLQIYGDCESSIFFAPHENESVIDDYLHSLAADKKITFIKIIQSKKRNISISIGNKKFSIDPNRIFTLRGIQQTLINNNPSLKPGTQPFDQAVSRVTSLSKFIIAHLGPLSKNSMLVAVHNNTNGFNGDGKKGEGTVSIHRYNTIKNRTSFIEDIFINEQHDEDNLFFTTIREDFEYLKSKKWNVILQHSKVASLGSEDDGSLSVWAQKSNVRYFNIEAERLSESGLGRDHRNEQIEMVKLILQLAECK